MHIFRIELDHRVSVAAHPPFWALNVVSLRGKSLSTDQGKPVDPKWVLCPEPCRLAVHAFTIPSLLIPGFAAVSCLDAIKGMVTMAVLSHDIKWFVRVHV